MRRLSRREKRLVFVLAAIAVCAAFSLRATPRAAPGVAEVKSFYTDAFKSAKQITIRPTGPSGEPVVVTRDKSPGLFSKLEQAAAYGGITLPSLIRPPAYILDLLEEDGSEIKDVSCGFTLDCPKQPAHGKLAFLPRQPGDAGPVSAMVDIIDAHLDPKGVEGNQKQRLQRFRQDMRTRRAGRSQPPASGGRPGGAPTEAPKAAPGAPTPGK